MTTGIRLTQRDKARRPALSLSSAIGTFGSMFCLREYLHACP